MSTTDPDSGWFHKGDHKERFAYTVNTCCDKNAFVLDFVVTEGNIHDSTSFKPLYEKIKMNNNIKNVVADSAYKTPCIAKDIIDSNKIPIFPYKNSKSNENLFHKNQFIYDKETNTFTCPNDCILKYSTTNRDGYIIYKSNKNDCINCPLAKQCTNSETGIRTISQHVFFNYMNKVEEYQIIYHDIYMERSKKIERVFANAKENHNLRFTKLKGIQKVTDEITFKFLCLNLKKLVNRIDKMNKNIIDSISITLVYFTNICNFENYYQFI